MKKILPIVGIVIAALLAFVIFKPDPKPDPDPCDNPPCEEPSVVTDSVISSFVFVGCNRVQWYDTLHSDKSMANIDVLTNIFKHVTASSMKPDYFFFLGDIVNGEATNKRLETELKTWNNDYATNVFTDFQSSGIKMIPVPGNHEMLDQNEKPLAGTTNTWMKYMGKFMPKVRDSITGSSNDADNRMTYGFIDGTIAYIVINTDTYNTDGERTRFPYDWVKKQVAIYRANKKIDHIFVMGHRPFYFNCKRETSGSSGIDYPSDSDPVWESFENESVASMLSAHKHSYQSMQPNKKTYQIVAGNGGSKLDTDATFFGYTRITVYASGKIKMHSYGYDAPDHYYAKVKKPTWSIRDSIVDMNWYQKGAPAQKSCNCVTGEK